MAAVCDAVFSDVRGAPTVLVIEDLHWVDAASIEVLRFLVRRLEAMPCAIVVTYRDDDIGPHHSARPLLGDFAALDHLTTLGLSPLSVDGVGELLGDAALDARRVARDHRREPVLRRGGRQGAGPAVASDRARRGAGPDVRPASR